MAIFFAVGSHDLETLDEDPNNSENDPLVQRKPSNLANEVVDSAVAQIGVKRSSKRCVVVGLPL